MRKEYSDDLKRRACDHFRSGGTTGSFAKESGVGRTTVIRWYNRWKQDNEITRWNRLQKLEIYQQVAILLDLIASDELIGRNDVRRMIQARTTYSMSALGILRYLQRWDIFPEHGECARIAGVLGTLSNNKPSGSRITHAWIEVAEWNPPAHLAPELKLAQNPLLWRMISMRGMERFIFTDDSTPLSAVMVSELLTKNRSWVAATDFGPLVHALAVK